LFRATFFTGGFLFCFSSVRIRRSRATECRGSYRETRCFSVFPLQHSPVIGRLDKAGKILFVEKIALS
jgi:hypothetical protein